MANALLAERRDFTAIVAGSDYMALGILRLLTKQRLRVDRPLSEGCVGEAARSLDAQRKRVYNE